MRGRKGQPVVLSAPHPIAITRWSGIIALLIAILLAGCTSRYVPEVTLPSSPHTIDAVAEFHSLHVAPSLISGHETFGVVAPRVKSLAPTDLTRQVEWALLEELERNRLFTRLTTFDPHPDLILTGRIDALYEHDRPQLWALAPGATTLARLFRINDYVSSGKVILTLIVLRATGEQIGEYRGHASFRETFTPNAEMRPGTRLNRALSTAVTQIRDQLLEERRLRTVRETVAVPRTRGR